MIGFSRTAQQLVCDGVPLSAIAEAEGTPVYVYSAAVLRERMEAEVPRWKKIAGELKLKPD